MNDDLDRMIQGDDQSDSSDSQSGNDASGSYSGSGVDDTQQTEGSEEEVEWSKLSSSAQDRFKRIYRERQQALEEANRLKDLLAQQGTTVQQNADGSLQMTPQVREAIDRLDKVGIATKDFVKQEISNILAQQMYSTELDKLEQKEDGRNGKPAFVKEEYFDFINRNPKYKNYLPEDVYEKMFSNELEDWKTKQGTGGSTRDRSQTLRPTRTASRESELTVDEIEAKLKSLSEPQRSEWYQANIKKINEAVARNAQG